MKYIENSSKKRVLYTRFCQASPLWLRSLLENKKCFWNPFYRAQITRKINNYDNKNIKNIEVWKSAYKTLCLKDSQYLQEASVFFEVNIDEVKKSNEEFSVDMPVLILIIKNDLMRVKLLLDHYRKIGVKRFAILDDDSSDGTFEFLQKQHDVDLYRSDVAYSTLGRQAWISRLIDLYGFDRWYIIVDSDELIAYSGMENVGIDSVIAQLDKQERCALRMMLLEMYPNEDVLALNNISKNQIVETYNYFDKVGYRLKYTDLLTCVVGGVRCRVFYDSDYKEVPFLTKYPVVKMKKGMIPCHSHMNYPFSCNRDMPLSGCILHYKFLPQDLEKYKQRVEKKNFQSGSKEYRKYLDVILHERKLTMYDEKISEKYINSSSLDVFNVEHFN